ncbi:GNAT family N-acetyltransferase [Mucilaginibacter segetis]|uniref:GNAT family N-acetyltransferase n=1 Tax=Mucilaginibacter segetis TaxID=2793071 RepID=A0A934PSD3_9SPHI|nr:GNAT family N-acetyltransferase [Mucilaginibacter segetis]MBK0378326.1 GNAT family N-acetyltransferase [Mucilaginibacter segetis]
MLYIKNHPFPELQTERLVLRQLQDNDASEILRLRTDEQVNKYIYRPKAKGIDDAHNFIQRITENTNNNISAFWVLTSKHRPGFIGTILFWNIDNEKETAEIGYELLPEYQGKGFMLEAARSVIAYGFNNIKFKAIEACTHAQNDASIKLLGKLGFKHLPDSKPEENEAVFILNADI